MDERYLLRVRGGAGRPPSATLPYLRDGRLREFAAMEDLIRHLRAMAVAGDDEDEGAPDGTGREPGEVME